MKIALVLPGGTGGGARSVTRIAEGLLARGHDVQVLCGAPPWRIREKARQLYLAIRYGQTGSWLRTFRGRARHYPYGRVTAKVVGSNDVVVGVGVDCALWIADLPAACGIKVYNNRGAEPWIRERMERAWSLGMPCIVNGAHLVAAMRQSGCTAPIHIAHNGLDRSQYYPVLPEDQRSGVGTVYHGGHVKDPGLILEVLHRLRRQRPDLPLLAFGGFPRPRHLPADTQYVRFPSLDVVRTFYSRSKVWFLASRSEGLPNPILEAMACGCGVVSTDCGGPRDMIVSGTNGFLTPVGDAEQMTARILQLLDDKAMRQGFVRASQKVLDHFTWPRAVEAFEVALEAIVGATGRNQDAA